MSQISNTKKKSIAAILFVVMLFSCTNDSKKVRDFLGYKKGGLIKGKPKLAKRGF